MSQPAGSESTAAPPASSDVVEGALHVFVAFDWGEELSLETARQSVRGEQAPLARRPRTPSSFGYRPMPVRVALPELTLPLAGFALPPAAAEATLFEFGGVSLRLRVPLRLSRGSLVTLAGRLSEPDELVQRARELLVPLFEQLESAIEQPLWSALSEEYFVFEFAPGALTPLPSDLLEAHAAWAAAVVRLESGPLSEGEIAEALRLRISYSPHDLFVAEWSAALLVDRECEETLQAVEFANLQLLEFRQIDERLDDRLARAYRLIHPLARSWLPFWHIHTQPLRTLGDLKIAAHEVYERTSNVLKLVGDPYLARVYRLLGQRLHLDDWSRSIEQSLGVVESVYQSVSDQASTFRTEMLEWIIILLIALEIAMTLGGH